MPPISIMIKPASSLCNMKCDYCFYHDVSEHRLEQSFGIMKEETAFLLIDKALQYTKGDSVFFAFQGGEPCLAKLQFFKSFTAYVRKRNTKRSKVYYSLQTNGTLLDENWARFLRQENFLVGLSFDGDYKANYHRKKSNGDNAYYKILQALELLQRFDVQFNILTVLTGECADNIENIYNFFKKKGCKYLQFIPCLRPYGDKQESPLYMTVQQYESFLIRLFQMYVKDYVRDNYISIRQFDNMVRLFLGQPAEQCGMMGHCTFQYVVEANGNIYPCDFYCTDEWLLGNIYNTDFQGLHNMEKAKKFIKDSLYVSEKCKQCKFYVMCRGGGCKRNKEDRDYCSSYYNFFSTSYPLFRVFLGEKANT